MEKKIRQALKKVIDPELNINIVDLGLVYGIKYENGRAVIKVTLTSVGCPLAGEIVGNIKTALKTIKEIKKISVKVVWQPPWSPSLVNPSVRDLLGFL